MFLTKTFYSLFLAIAAMSAVGIWLPSFYWMACAALAVLVLASVADAVLLLMVRLEGSRVIAPKLDLGESNKVIVSFRVVRGRVRLVRVTDEMPQMMMENDENLPVVPMEEKQYEVRYVVHPLERGQYVLGRCLVFCQVIGLLEHRITLIEAGDTVDVYPAFSRLREKDITIRTSQVNELGAHKTQLPVNQTEFRDIREYVVGDDIRCLNWKATARVGTQMVNEYEDEKSQFVLNILDCGRDMHRSFNGMMLLDHAVNATLMLSYSALMTEGDSVGVASFTPSHVQMLPPRPGKQQLHGIMHNLYNLKAEYGESDMEQLCLTIDRTLKRHSIVFMHTDFTTVKALERVLPSLQRIARRHTLVVVMMRDHEMDDKVVEAIPKVKTISLEEMKIVRKASASITVEQSLTRSMLLQKQQIVDTLIQLGMHCLYIYPNQLSYSIVRKYLEIKARR